MSVSIVKRVALLVIVLLLANFSVVMGKTVTLKQVKDYVKWTLKSRFPHDDVDASTEEVECLRGCALVAQACMNSCSSCVHGGCDPNSCRRECWEEYKKCRISCKEMYISKVKMIALFLHSNKNYLFASRRKQEELVEDLYKFLKKEKLPLPCCTRGNIELLKNKYLVKYTGNEYIKAFIKWYFDEWWKREVKLLKEK